MTLFKHLADSEDVIKQRGEERCKSVQEAQGPLAKNRQKKAPASRGIFFCFKEFKGLEAVYGAADGTRTRDPRRDRPVF